MGADFRVFRGCCARATRLAARRAEPLFLLACAVLRSRPNKTRFFRSRTRLSVDFDRLGALPDAPGRSFWRPGVPLGILLAFPGRGKDAPGRSRDAPETLPRSIRDALGRHEASRKGPEINFGSILGALRAPRDRFSIDLCDEFRSLLRASCPANGIALYGSAHRRTHAA